jgi:hypothetical protein
VPPLMKDDFPFDVRRDIVNIALTAESAATCLERFPTQQEGTDE